MSNLNNNDKADIYKLLNDYGVKYIVIEDKDVIGIEVLQLLREVLKSENFTPVKKIKINSTVKKLEGVSLVIYEYKQNEFNIEDRIVIPFPHLGRKIDVSIKALLNFGSATQPKFHHFHNHP